MSASGNPAEALLADHLGYLKAEPRTGSWLQDLTEYADGMAKVSVMPPGDRRAVSWADLQEDNLTLIKLDFSALAAEAKQRTEAIDAQARALNTSTASERRQLDQLARDRADLTALRSMALRAKT